MQLAESLLAAVDAVGLNQLIDFDVFIVHINRIFGYVLLNIVHLIFQLDSLFHSALELSHDLYMLLANRLLDPFLVAVHFARIVHHGSVDFDQLLVVHFVKVHILFVVYFFHSIVANGLNVLFLLALDQGVLLESLV